LRVSRANSASPQASRAVLLLSVCVTALLYAWPLGRTLSYPLVLLSTLAHELGHGVAALIAGGRFASFELYPDASGVALTSAQGRFAEAFVAAGGLIGPSIAALIFFVVGKKPGGARLFLGLIGVLLAIALLLVVRAGFGWFFVAVLAATCFLIAWADSARWSQLVLVFGGTQLALSVYSRRDYLFTPLAHTNQGLMPSDVAQMSEALLLPYWFWGLACGAISVAVLVFGVRYYWSGPRA
jgi:hypothetical protein